MKRAKELGKAIKKGKFLRLSRTKLSVLLAFFLVLSLISAILVFIAHSTPLEEKKFTTLSNYQHTGKYAYVASLKPNEIYENRSTLGPEELGPKPLYIRLVENIKVTFDYRFICDNSGNITTDYRIDVDLESPGKWVKSFTIAPENSIVSTGKIATFSAEYLIDLSWFDNRRRAIEAETGTSSSSYNLKIKPSIKTVAVADVGTIDENFAPELVVSFNYRGAEGDYISVSGLVKRSSGAIQQAEDIFRPEVASQRNISYAMTAIALVGLVLTGFGFMKTKPPEKRLEEIIAPFEEAVIGVAKEPSYKEQRTIITMKSLEDLVHVADGLGKPILHLKKPTRAGAKEEHVFYVLDGLVRYEYGVKVEQGRV